MYSTSKYNSFNDIIIASLFMKAELRSIKLIMHALSPLRMGKIAVVLVSVYMNRDTLFNTCLLKININVYVHVLNMLLLMSGVTRGVLPTSVIWSMTCSSDLMFPAHKWWSSVSSHLCT